MARWRGPSHHDEYRHAFVLGKDPIQIGGEAEYSAIGLSEHYGVTTMFTDSGFKKMAARVTADEFRWQFSGLLSDHYGYELLLANERVYLLLAKSLTDNLAWEVQDRRIDGYFRARGLNVARPATRGESRTARPLSRARG